MNGPWLECCPEYCTGSRLHGSSCAVTVLVTKLQAHASQLFKGLSGTILLEWHIAVNERNGHELECSPGTIQPVAL